VPRCCIGSTTSSHLVFLAFACYWAVTQVTHRISRDISDRLAAGAPCGALTRVAHAAVLDVLSFIIIALLLLKHRFDVNVTAALAGLGIGGLAIGLGAQRRFENCWGDFDSDGQGHCTWRCVQDRRSAGVVEDIGLRSTKLRTENRTLVRSQRDRGHATLENFRFATRFCANR